LEQVAPGATMTVRADEKTPEAAAPGVELADGSSAQNRLLSKVAITDIDKTVMVKGQAQPVAGGLPRQAPSQHAGPVELVWPRTMEVKAPPGAHE
jgi:hypothetical protein